LRFRRSFESILLRDHQNSFFDSIDHNRKWSPFARSPPRRGRAASRRRTLRCRHFALQEWC
jgi:hypothetical protein